jgi:putative transposase
MSSSSTVVLLRQPDAVDDPLTAVLRDGARRLLAQVSSDIRNPSRIASR